MPRIIAARCGVAAYTASVWNGGENIGATRAIGDRRYAWDYLAEILKKSRNPEKYHLRVFENYF
jgi:hypothetical protein